MFKVNNKSTKNKNVFIVDFEQVNVSWKVLSDVSYYCDHSY